MKAKKALVTKERDVRTHAELWHTSNCLLESGKQVREGSAHQFRASLVFRAFALEAYLNWQGTSENLDEFLDAKLGTFIQTDWERFCTLENAMERRKMSSK